MAGLEERKYYSRLGKEAIKKILKKQRWWQMAEHYKKEIGCTFKDVGGDAIKETGGDASFSWMFKSIESMLEKYKCYWRYKNLDGDTCSLTYAMIVEDGVKIIIFENREKGTFKRLRLKDDKFDYYERSPENPEWSCVDVSHEKIEKDIIPFFNSQLKVQEKYYKNQKDENL